MPPKKGGSAQMYYNTQDLINTQGYTITGVQHEIKSPIFSDVRQLGGAKKKKKKPIPKK
jgi:hypothetical protein